MATIVTGAEGTLAYCNARSARHSSEQAFRLTGSFPGDAQIGFARFPGFPDNANHAPTGQEGAATCDLALDFLYRVARRG
ncbi:hypothetical protein ACFSUD_04780 [Sulfitobacter aestuarii]|uniref:Uncharacterized protein n=1 Tax=Sulfitobacter aestuarii TaxID=2161676 RepID=A0ABW5TZY6_9RHOB